MQEGDSQHIGAKEPVGDINVLGLALDDRSEEHDCVDHPDHCDQDIERPDQFRVFLTLGQTHRERNYRTNDDGLPAPESECGELEAVAE